MKEPKYQILKPTGCYVGGHVWTWTSAGDRQSEPPAGKRCNCGAFTWAEREKAGKEIRDEIAFAGTPDTDSPAAQ